MLSSALFSIPPAPRFPRKAGKENFPQGLDKGTALDIMTYEQIIICAGDEMNERDFPECCELISTHPDILEKVRREMPNEDTLYDLTELFHIFGDSTRMRILYVLFAAEMCVCDIAALLGITQSAISHQLRLLKSARLVKSRREGKTVFYSLADDHVKTIINQGLEHVNE